MIGPETFPGRLAQARRRLAYLTWEDVTDKRLAELVGTTTATMSRWMAGQLPSREWMAKLSAVLGVSAQYLEYGGDELGIPGAAQPFQGAPIARSAIPPIGSGLNFERPPDLVPVQDSRTEEQKAADRAATQRGKGTDPQKKKRA